MKIIVRDKIDNHCLDSVVSNEIVRNILLSRGVTDSRDLDLSLKNLLHYKDLKDIDKASNILADAIIGNKAIAICGDYDVDGMTGTALGVLILDDFGAKNISYHMPSRYDDGYGLSTKAVQVLHNKGVNLIVTVDNGISANEAIAKAKELGMQVIISDHHECPANLPQADAIVNPKQADCKFSSKNLSGVGVLFYLFIATRQVLIDKGYFKDIKPNLSMYLDLVALGTIGDLVPLDTNNRRIVKAGLSYMQKGFAQVGLKALAKICRSTLDRATVSTFAFEFCPRLNAATRLNIDTNYALLLLLEKNYVKAIEYARQLDFCNKRRNDYEKVMCQDAMNMLATYEKDCSVVLYKESFLEGVCGLIANRVKDNTNKPSFIFAKHKDLLTGSGRSVNKVPLAKILQEIDSEHPHLLERFGGHNMAAGLSIQPQKLEFFAQIFEDKVKACLTQDIAEDVIYTDAHLAIRDINLDFARLIQSYGPYGQGFEEPCFDGIFEVDSTALVAERHMRYRLKNQEGSFDSILFRATKEQMNICAGQMVHVIYTLGISHYMEQDRLSVKLLHLIKL